MARSDDVSSKWVLLSVAASCLASGCHDERPPIVWEGEHLRFGTYEDTATICEGTLPYMDAFVGYIGDLFERPDARVDYYWVPEDLDSYCRSNIGGCTAGIEVISERTLHKHEIVHAARSNAYLPIEEGIAELYGDQTLWREEPTPAGMLGLLAEHEHGRLLEESAKYRNLGHFASYLRVIGGVPGLAELGRRTVYDGSFRSIDPVFQDVYQRPLTTVVNDYLADYPVCDQTRHADNGFECGRNLVRLPTQGEGPLDLEIPLDCDQPDVLGPRWGERWTMRTLDVPTTARYRVYVDDLNYTGIRVRRCGVSCFDERHVAPRFDNGLWGDEHCLLAGRYLLLVAVTERHEGNGKIRLEYSQPEGGYCTAPQD
jgi:hypothetical protein